MNCKHCGKAISDSDTICPACGNVTGIVQLPKHPRPEAGQNSEAGEFWGRMQGSSCQTGQTGQAGQQNACGQFGQQNQYGTQGQQGQYSQQGQYGQQAQYGQYSQQGQYGQFGQQAWQKVQTTFSKPEGYGYGDPAYPAGFPRYDTAGHELSPKNRIVLSLLCAALGTLGIHRFYAGKIGTGILMILTLGGFGIWWIIDLIFCCVGSFKDKEGRLIASY